MYTTILVPVDLEHVERLDKALATAADLARHYGAALVYVGVTASAPGAIAHSLEEYARKLEAFAEVETAKRGVPAKTRPLLSHDPTTDLDATLLKAIDDLGADLVVMASHVPGFAEHIFASNAGYVASHAQTSVLVVR